MKLWLIIQVTFTFNIVPNQYFQVNPYTSCKATYLLRIDLLKFVYSTTFSFICGYQRHKIIVL